MEHAAGVPLHQKWPEMAGDQRVKCIDAIYRKMKEMVDLRFPAFGSLYFANSPNLGGVHPLDEDFCIGPHCGTRYWDCNVGEQRHYHSVQPNQGPYDDPTTITGIIDWQATSIEPAFWYSDEIPDFAVSTDTGDTVYAEAFELSSRFLTPILSGPRLMDETLLRPFRYSYRTWKDGAVALRHDMIEAARHWKELGLPGQCLYPLPMPNELADHEKEYKLFEAAQVLRRDLSNLLNIATDGWVPPEEWETTELAHREVLTGMLEAVTTNQELDEDEPVKDGETLRSIWPFDIPALE
ncbi:hypothetical protein APSETT445_005095 [Aspergillus pseudonomiae]